MTYAPIALFIYNRPKHTRQALECLMRCPEFGESPLYIFCDGPRNTIDKVNVCHARDVVRVLVGDKAVLIESEKNKGLANSIISGVGSLCAEYGRVIVVEDDLIVGSAFLTYLNAALEKYADEEKVMQVSAYMFPVPEFRSKQEAFFLPFTTSWGWATWQRAWRNFDEKATGWEQLKSDKIVRLRFNIEGVGKYFNMLKQQMKGAADSWAIRWYWSVFKCDGLVLFPPVSYVQNKGFDGSGTHGWRTARAVVNSEIISGIDMVKFPDEILVNGAIFSEVKKVLRKLNRGYLNLFKLLKTFLFK